MFAIIDIGSNSVRLMLWADGKTLYKRVNTTRLGEGLAGTGVLSAHAIERTAKAVADYCAEGRAKGASVYAFATAAVRSGANGGEFCRRVKELCGLDVDVIQGREEALLGLFGALGENDGGIVDIGGASTEICLRKGGKIAFTVSLNTGAVRLFDKCLDKEALLREEIGRAISILSPIKPCGKVYAIGGTASTVASVKLALKEYDGDKIQDCPLYLHEVAALADRLLSFTAEERKRLSGMDEKRADIIAGGSLLLAEIMKKLSLSAVYASDRDNLEGYLSLRGLK